jgi:uncharacterized protein
VSAPNNAEHVRSLYEAFARGDVQAILDALAPDVDWMVQGPATVPLYGARRGPEQVAQFFRAIGEGLALEDFSPREFLAQGDRVIVLGYERGRAIPTGREFQGEWVHVFTFRDGRVVAFREYGDTAALAEAFRDGSRSAA